ncbi:MAG: GTPase, partial [Phycisphaerae bacterium]
DEVIVGCRGKDYFAIHCHGNPLITADIMRLLESHGAEPVSAEKILTHVSGGANPIATEVEISVANAKTLKATKLIMHQADKGLGKTAAEWKNNPDFEITKAQAQEILRRSKKIRPLLFGAKIVLIGPPNSGKSTLLNYLAGKQKSIVSETQGTTRDWVSAECMLGEIFAEIIDTAGIDEKLYSHNERIEKATQQNAKEIIADADLILLVIDGSVENDIEAFNVMLVGKNVLTVANKIDLPAKTNLPGQVGISAKFGTGCDELVKKIEQVLGTEQLEQQNSICFTERQEKLLEQIASAKNKEAADSAISELLKGGV